MLAEYILLEILLGAMLLGFIGAYRKRLFDRIVLFLTIPVSFIGAIVLTKSALFDTAVDMVLDLTGLAESADFSASLLTLIEGAGGAAVRPIVATVIFWILLFILRIVVGIILGIIHLITGAHRRAKEAKRNKVKKPLWNKLGTGIVGALSGFIIVMLSLLPLVYVNNLVEPAVDTALAEENEGTYVNEIAKTVDENAMPLSERTTLGKIRKYTGMKALTDMALTTLTDVDVTLDSGKEISFNLTELISTLANEGVKAAAIYERSCESTGTLGDFKPMASILTRIADNDAIINLCTAVYTDFKEDIFGSDTEIAYDFSDATAFKTDLKAIANLVDLLVTDLGTVAIDGEDLLPEILNYLEKEESSKKLVNIIGQTGAYKTNFPVLMEYALELICDQVDISENKSEDYESFTAALAAALNNKSVGIYDEDGVEYFIKDCAESGRKVSDFLIHDANDMTDLEKAYLSYVDFMMRKTEVEEVFADYLLDDEKLTQFYVGTDGTVYVFNEDESKWSYFTGDYETELRKSSYAAQLLANAVNSALRSDPDVAVDPDFAKQLADAVKESFYASNTVIRDNTYSILGGICAEADYLPDNAVYREDIINSLNKDAVIDKQHNDSFGTALSVMANLYGSLTEESEEATIDTVMDNFHLIGRLLDSLKAMETTAEIPDKMLLAIMRNKNYGAFFASQAVQDTLENVRRGEATYEQLFTTVQSFYGLASGIVPGGI